MAIEFSGADTANSLLSAVTSGTAGNKNATYTELIASTARESHMITLQVCGLELSEASRVYLATGAASSEVDLFSITFFGNFAAGSSTGETVTFPFTIGSGVRLSANAACQSASHDVGLMVGLSDDDTLGTSTEASLFGASATQGTTIDPGGTANTKGSWTELVASTGHDIDIAIVSVGFNSNSVASNNYHYLVDIGTGAASSETVVIPNIYTMVGSQESPCNQWSQWRIPISSGTRIAARSQCDNTDATDRLLDVAVFGINVTAPAGGGGGGVKLGGRGGGMAG